jgi:hypothetical protein
VLIVGGGYIAVEFAGIFRGLGATVTLAYRGDQVLRGFDDDVRAHLSIELVKHGIDLRLHATPESIERLRTAGARDLRTSAGLEHDRGRRGDARDRPRAGHARGSASSRSASRSMPTAAWSSTNTARRTCRASTRSAT